VPAGPQWVGVCAGLPAVGSQAMAIWSHVDCFQSFWVPLRRSTTSICLGGRLSGLLRAVV
jgi:hypothetical protein